MPKNKIVNVNIIINATRLINDFTGKTVSKDSTRPTPIDHTYQYMVVSEGSSISGQGTGDLSFGAKQGDVVRFYATSEFNNFDVPVILYDLFKISGDDVFSNPDFTLEPFPGTETVAPKSFNPLVLKNPNPNQDFWFAQNTVNSKGTEAYGLKFAVYNSDLTLFGYFQWDPTIIGK